jgi:hypothetical protein
LKGIVVAGALAAAVGGLDSILAALAQTTLSTLILPLRGRRVRAARTPEAEERAQVRLSRVLVFGWGVALCAAAILIKPLHDHYQSVLQLALSMATYTSGALLAGFALAFLPLRIDDGGYRWSAPLSVVSVFALAWHVASGTAWAREACLSVAVLALGAWILLRLRPEIGRSPVRAVSQLGVLLVALALILAFERYAVFENGDVIAWPWYIPIGSLYAFVFGILLARPREET